MSDFLTIFEENITSTIEGLTGVVPELEYIDSEDNVIDLDTPITQMNISVTGESEGNMSILMHANLTTALADMMLGGEGESKDAVDDDDLDAIGEIISNILGSFSTALSAQNELPNLSFTVANSTYLDDTESIDTSSYASVYTFQLSIASLNLPLFLLVDKNINPIISGEDDNNSSQNNAQVNNSSLSDKELSNVNLLLDVKLPIRVRIGSKVMLLKDVTNMDIGSVIELDQLANEPLDVLVGDKMIAKGEVVIVDGNFGVQITKIGSVKERLEQLK